MVGSDPLADPSPGAPAERGGLYYPRNHLPPLSTFKVDVGAGIDFGDFGVYWAKAINNSADDPVRFIVRLQHRF
jgi:hypothetical protein